MTRKTRTMLIKILVYIIYKFYFIYSNKPHSIKSADPSLSIGPGNGTWTKNLN